MCLFRLTSQIVINNIIGRMFVKLDHLFGCVVSLSAYLESLEQSILVISVIFIFVQL